MTETPRDTDGVLKPFEEPELAPLPPVEPSQVVPESRAVPEDAETEPDEPVEGDDAFAAWGPADSDDDISDDELAADDSVSDDDPDLAGPEASEETFWPTPLSAASDGRSSSGSRVAM